MRCEGDIPSEDMNILFVTSNRIGDAVLSSGILGYLIERHPQCRITVACGPAAAPLFAATPNVERIISVAKRRLAGHWLGLWSATVWSSWDMVIDLRASLLAWTLRARRRHVLRKLEAPLHRTALYAGTLGLAQPPPPKIWIGEAHRSRAARLIPEGSPVLAVGPTANWGGKQWPAPSFSQLVERLTAPDAILARCRVAVLGAAHERPAAWPVIDHVAEQRRIDLVGAVDLLDAFACLERCALFIGNDSGLMHLAAASGVPTLGLFGPSREVHYAPSGERTAVVRTEASYEDLVGGPGYDHRNHDSLMGSLSVDAVERAAAALWRRSMGNAA